MVKKNPDFRFNRMRKSGKTEFFEVHIERALITHLMTTLFLTFRNFLAACVHARMHCTVPNNKHSAPFSSERISSMAASRSKKFELIGYSPACLCSFQNWGSGNFSPFHLRKWLSAYSLSYSWDGDNDIKIDFGSSWEYCNEVAG